MENFLLFLTVSELVLRCAIGGASLLLILKKLQRLGVGSPGGVLHFALPGSSTF